MNHRFALRFVGLGVLALAAGAAFAEPVSQAIHLDHFGYRPSDPKIAILEANPGASVQIRDAATSAVVFTVSADGGSIVSAGADGAASGDSVWWVDFSVFSTPGSYHLYSATLNGQSYDFELGSDVYNGALHAAVRTFYLQRCNTPKLAAHAGDWEDPAACHMGDVATGPAAGHTNLGLLNLTGGWHDAGDYNKYAWRAAAAAVMFLLRAYEDNPGLFVDGDLDLPESGNGRPDLLDEVKWELDWLLRMQRPNGSVLYQMHVDGFASDAPPSADTNVRHYQNPNMESAAVLAGSAAYASRVFAATGEAAYATTLRNAAIAAWTWLGTQPDSAADDVREAKAWAAAELYRTDPTQTSAKSYVDGFYPSSWSGRFFNVARFDTHAATTYVQTPGATAAVVANMRASIGAQVDYLFANDDKYRNGMPSWSYHWGSNSPRACQGLFLLKAADLGATGAHSATESRRHAQEMLHFFHGQNTLGMLYLSNMAALGGEHSSFQFYHAWFGDSTRAASRDNFLGKPSTIVEPAYPYFAGVDNLGASDGDLSAFGPAPGFVPGGPNSSYSGIAIPPGGATYWNRFYRDWADQSVDWRSMTWEITENSIGYQGPYVALVAAFSDPAAGGCDDAADCDDGQFCNGAESCSAGACVAGGDPCPGQSCDEAGDFCFADPCDHDGLCEAGESCGNCASDCISGAGGACGDGVCQPASGEDCLSCAADCAGRTGGKPSARYCCGDGDGPNPLSCGAAQCTSNGFQCSTAPAPPFCCGDGACTNPENRCSCGLDCGLAPAVESSCTNGVDDDCDAGVDCDDLDCVDDPTCASPGCDGDSLCEPGESCTTCPGDCAGRSGGKPAQRYCCGDGIHQSAESSAICDSNF